MLLGNTSLFKPKDIVFLLSENHVRLLPAGFVPVCHFFEKNQIQYDHSLHPAKFSEPHPGQQVSDR